MVVKGTGHFFETLSVDSVAGTDHSQIYAFLINNRFQAEKCIYKPKKGVGIQNGRYRKIAGHVYNTGNLICFYFICLLFKN